MAQQSPLLDDYNNSGIVTPALQKALDLARQKLPQFQLPQTTAAPAPTPRFTPPGMQVPSISRTPATAGLTTPPAPVAAAPATPAAATPPLAGRTSNPQDVTDITELNRLKNTGSGISQIQNPVARGLLRAADVLGSAFVPRITAGIPGTELHHNYLVNRAEGTVDKDVTRAKENATTAKTEAETGAIPGEEALRTAQTNEANARARNPLDWAESAEPAVDPEHPEKGPQHFFYNKANPTQRQFGGTMAAKPVDHPLATHIIQRSVDGKAHNVLVDSKTGEDIKDLGEGKSDKPLAGHVIQRVVGGKLHDVLVHAQTGEDIKDLGETRQPSANTNDHGVTMIGKDGKVYRLEPGQSVPEGAQTPTQAGSQNTPTTQMRNVAAQAQLVHEQTPYMLSEIDRLKDKLGPMAGRWNEVMQGKLGMKDPDFAGLRADMLMYSSAVALMHARGRLPENLREEFDQTINNPGQDFANLKSVITKIDNWTVKNPGVKDEAGGSNGLPGGITLDEINAEIERRKNPKK